MVQDNDLFYVSVVPFTRINENWKIKSERLKTLLENFDNSKTYRNFHDECHIENADPKLYQQAFLHIVTETIYHYPHNANGEKTFKPISCLRPFIIVSLPGALQHLKNLGFKTFSNWWDESYDSIQDPDDRIWAIIGIIEDICTKDIDDLKQMLLEMKQILHFNHTHYYNTFLQDQMLRFEQSCLQNLKPR